MGMLDPGEMVRATMPMIGAKSRRHVTRRELIEAGRRVTAADRKTWQQTYDAAVAEHGEEEAEAMAWAAVREERIAADPIGRLMRQYELSDVAAQGKLLVFPRGKFKHPEFGVLTFDDEFLEEIKANYDNGVLGQTKPFVDFEHKKGEAAGWFDAGLSIEPDGLYALVNWTELGQKKLEAREYRYFSPWWGKFEDAETGKKYDRVLRGGALTNVPFLKVLPDVGLMEPAEHSVGLRRARAAGRVFMLSELTSVVERVELDEESNLELLPQRVRMAFSARYASGPFYAGSSGTPWVVEIHEDHVIACAPENGRERHYELPWDEVNGEIVFFPEDRVEVVRAWLPVDEVDDEYEDDEDDEAALAEIRETEGPMAALAEAVRQARTDRLVEAILDECAGEGDCQLNCPGSSKGDYGGCGKGTSKGGLSGQATSRAHARYKTALKRLKAGAKTKKSGGKKTRGGRGTGLPRGFYDSPSLLGATEPVPPNLIPRGSMPGLRGRSRGSMSPPTPPRSTMSRTTMR